VSLTATGALVGAAACLVAAPYLAALARTVPRRENRQWWRGIRTTGREIAQAAGLGVGLGALAGAAAGWTALLPAFLVVALFGTPLILIDLAEHRLPNRLVVPAAVGGAALLTVAAAVEDEWHRLLRAAEGAAAVYVVLFLLATFARGGFGMGDVKLGGVLGAYLGWFGWKYVYYGILAGFVLGAVLSVALLAGRRATMKTAIPFGPMLVVGPLLVLAFDLVL
jgi:leader peptidase (prepilin peptidase)/N-methyltransferase